MNDFNIEDLVNSVNKKKELLYVRVGNKKVEAFLASINRELIELQQTPSTACDLVNLAYWSFVLTFYSEQLQVLRDLQQKEALLSAGDILRIRY